MTTSTFRFARFAALCISFAAAPLAAQQIIQPVAASTDMPGFRSSPPERMIDQSALGANYIDGVTDFDSFVAATSHSNSNQNSLVTRFVVGGTITFDLGTARVIDGIHLWGQRTAANQLMEFDLLTDNDADFQNGTDVNLGRFVGGNGQGGRTFRFGAVTTRFVHILVVANGGGTVVKVGEAAFRRFTPIVGSGCSGSGGVPSLNASTTPTLNSSFVTTMNDLAPGNGSGFMVIGSVQEQTPFNLAVLGAPDCFLFINNIVATPFATTGGSATFSLTIPADPGLRGVTLFEQAVNFDPAANQLGFTTSNALSLTIR